MDPNANPPLATLDQDDPMAGVEDVVTEDGQPVESQFHEKQQRLLTEPLYSSWTAPGGAFVAMADVGMFLTTKEPPLVPDALLSVDVKAPDNLFEKKNRAYFIPVYGKPPEVCIEVVSNREGNEDGSKLLDYARFGVRFYVIFDPLRCLRNEVLRAFVLRDGSYVRLGLNWFPEVGLGVTLWEGNYEGSCAVWLRWCDASGIVIPTGAEALQEERLRADAAAQRAEEESRKVEKLRALLKAQGIDPDAIQ